MARPTDKELAALLREAADTYGELRLAYVRLRERQGLGSMGPANPSSTLRAAADALEREPAAPSLTWDAGLAAAIERGKDAERMREIFANQERRTYAEQDELSALCLKYPEYAPKD